MTEPDEALLWARDAACRPWAETDPEYCRQVQAGDWDDNPGVSDRAHAYRAGGAASYPRIKALEEANAALEDMASRHAIQMSEMLTRLGERYPEDSVWLKGGDQ